MGFQGDRLEDATRSQLGEAVFDLEVRATAHSIPLFWLICRDNRGLYLGR